MKQKLFTLLTLLLAVCSGAWADDTYEYTNTPALNTSNYFTVAKGSSSASTFNVSITFNLANGTSTTVTKAVKMESATTITFTTTRTADVYVGLYDRNGTSKDSKNNQFKLNSTVYTATNSTDAGSYEIVSIEDVEAGEYSITNNGKEVEVYYVKVIEKGENTTPSFKATVTGSKLTLKSAPTPFTPTAESTFTLTGENLTAGEYNFTIPSVSGTLTITPNKVTVKADGTLQETSYTVSYAGPGTDVSATDANITATINGITATIPVNYRAMAALIAQTNVTASETWDWNDLKSSPDLSTYDTEVAFANYDDIEFPASFDATKLMVSGSTNANYGGAYRLGKLKFHSTVAGTITLDFSDTGNKSGSGEGTKRYIKLNGQNTEYYTNRQEGTDNNKNDRKSCTLDVEAGDVTIEGTSYIQLYSLVFTVDDGKTDLTSFAFSGGTTTVTTETTDDFVAPTLTAMAGEDNVTSTIASNVTYASNNTDVATVDASTGVVTLTGTAGTATITATLSGNDTYKDNTASYTITVEEVAATGITAVTSKTWNFSDNAWTSVNANSSTIIDNMEIIVGSQALSAPSSASPTLFPDASSYAKYYVFKSSANQQMHFKVAPYSKITVYIKGGNGRYAKVTVGSTDGDVLMNELSASSAANPSCAYTGETEGDIYLYNGGTSNNLNIYAVKVEPLPYVTLNTSGYGTFSYATDVEIAGADAYTAALDVDNAKITCTKIADGKVPAGAGVLLYGEASAKAYLCPASSVAALSNNNLKGTTNASGETVEKGSNTYYVLSGDTFVTYNGDAFSANKAYFEVSSGTVLARNFSIVFEDESTGISASLMNSKKVNSEVYNLNGQRVMNPTKGLYIVNGRKVVIK